MSVDPPLPDVDSDDDSPRRANDAPEGREGASPSPPIPSTETLRDAPTRAPKRIGHYHIKRVLASGGMGTVYEATQEKPRRTVALKLMKHGIASRSALRRFEYESQILARLRHPGIAQVYEAGTHRDDSGTVPFFAMEYIVGAKPITRYAKEKKLGTRERMILFAQVCDAVHHGHQKGIIHRDLKPSNILVDASGQVKIIDFGVARSTDSDLAVTTLQTDIGQLIGTLQYMSPEQCEADPHNIDTRSDVYALGVVFYELLCGKLPYDVTRVALYTATRIIREEQPAKLSTLNKTLRGDVETIVLKALEKDRERRYQSATDFAQDIRRYLSNEAIIARPPSVIYQFRVLMRRNKPVFASIAVVFVVLVCATIVSTTQYFKAERARLEAVAARDVARQQRDRAITAERRAEEEAQRALTEAAKSEQIATFMKDMLKGVGPSKALGRDTTMLREILDQTAQRVGAKLANQPEVEASIRNTIGQTYVDLGIFGAADEHLRAAEAIATRELGDEDPQTLRIRAAFARLLQYQGEFPAAEALVRRTLEIQRRVLGHRHPDTLACLNSLADLRGRQGYYAEAETLYHQALEARRDALGNEHPDTLGTMHSLATALRTQGKYPEAETLERQTLAIRRRVLGDDHPDTLDSIQNLAVVLRHQGKQAEAEPLYRQSVDIKRRVLGAEHPSTLKSMNNLAFALEKQGKYAAAEEVYRQTVDLKRRVLGDEHHSTRVSMGGLAGVLHRQGKSEEARFYHTEMLVQLRHLVNSPDADSNALNSYAWFLLKCESTDLRDPEAALLAAQKAVEVSEPPNFGMLDTLALAYRMTGDIDKAIETQQAVVALLPSGESEMRTRLEITLGEYFTEKGAFAEAEPLFLEAYHQTKNRLGAGPEQIREALQRLVNLYEAWSRADKADEYRAMLPSADSPEQDNEDD